MPSGYTAADLAMPVHTVALVTLGLWLIDNVAMACCPGGDRLAGASGMLGQPARGWAVGLLPGPESAQEGLEEPVTLDFTPVDEL
jgi:hypothetical protein